MTDSRTPKSPATPVQPSGAAEETFKREGPVPPAGDTGATVEEMNDAARDAVLRNVTPEPDEGEEALAKKPGARKG